ncbi:Me1, partial [Symbiodinium sp. KB8]
MEEQKADNGKGQQYNALLPPVPGSRQQCVDRVLYCLDRLADDLMKFHYLMTVKRDDPNTFYAAALQNIERIMPLVYTPTVGTACLHYDKVFQPHHGLYLPITQKGRVKELLQQWPQKDIEAIVFTDGEAILGLGDLGSHGMGIPIGKMALYSLCAGIHPKACLPITLDVGTNNKDLLEDPSYTGLRQERVRGEEYEAFVKEFFDAAQALYGKAVLLQFEDFGNGTAFPLLDRFRGSACTFNDDIQGTAAVITSGLITASREAKLELKDMRVVFYGAGAAGVGIADLIAYTIAREAGSSTEECRKNIFLVDSKGLITSQRDESSLAGHKKPYAHDWSDGEVPTDLENIVKALKPHALIGVSAQ